MRKTYIRCGWIITMNDENTVIRDGCIEISGKWLHRIHTDTINIFPKEDIVVIDAPHMVALPGLIDIHTHVCGNLFKGLLEDARDGFYSLALPMEKRLTPEFVYSLSLSGAAECLMGGITMVNDMYHCALSTAQAIDDLGMRGVVAGKIYEADLTRLQYCDHTFNRATGQHRLEENIALIEKYGSGTNDRIFCRFGPHATDTISLDLAKKISLLMEKYNVGCHIHAAQSQREVDFLREAYNLSAIEFLEESGLLCNRTTAAHCLYVDDTDISLLARGGVTLAHCPDMNGSKSGPLAPIYKLYKHNVSIAYGTDWTNSDLWSTMRMGIAVGRLSGCSSDERNALDALRRCTILPARHLGVDHLVGSLEAGKRADLILVDLHHPGLCPIHDDPIATLVYNATARDVDTVIVDGRILVNNKQLISMDSDAIIANAQRVAQHIFKS